MELTYSFLAIAIFLFPFIYLSNWFLSWKKRADLINLIPGPYSIPILGNSWQLMTTREKVFSIYESRVKNYRPIFRSWVTILPVVHIMKPDHIEIILSNTRLTNKGFIYKFLQPWLGTGLVTSTGSKWHSRRKLLTPTFHFKILENFIDVFEEKSNVLVNHLLEPLSNGQEFDACPLITRCALDIICKTAMGVDVHAMYQTNSSYVAAIHEITEIVVQRMIHPWLLIDAVFYRLDIGKRFSKCLSVVHGFTNKVIRERKEILKKGSSYENSNENNDIGKKKRMAFLDLLIEVSENGANLSESDIREEVDTFMFGGHDTTTAAICWTLFLLGNYPKIQDKVVEELNDIFGNDNRTISKQDLANMKYLERVIKESLRLYPSAPFIQRRTTEVVNIGDYVIPENTLINIHIRSLHRDPKYFPNPEEFNPDNFLPENCQHRHPFAYIPFSAGIRNCIGQKFAMLEQKTILATILRKYIIKSVEKPEDIKYYAEIILRSQTGIKLRITPRHQ